MTPGQPLPAAGEEYNKVAFTREVQALHDRINDLGVNPPHPNLKADYAAADLASAAAHAAALNSTNIAINAILAKLNLT